MIQAGVDAGLSEAHARRLTIATIKGAAALMEASKETPEQLRQKVTSPGGTTQAAMDVLEGAESKKNIVTAVLAAATRAEALSG